MIILASGGETALAIRSTRGWRRGRASCVDGVMPDFKAASTVDLAMPTVASRQLRALVESYKGSWPPAASGGVSLAEVLERSR